MKWTYRDKYNDNMLQEVTGQNNATNSPTYGLNYTEERILAWEYSTGNVVIDDLGCLDDQVYYCNVSAEGDPGLFLPVTYYEVKLGEYSFCNMSI